MQSTLRLNDDEVNFIYTGMGRKDNTLSEWMKKLRLSKDDNFIGYAPIITPVNGAISKHMDDIEKTNLLCNLFKDKLYVVDASTMKHVKADDRISEASLLSGKVIVRSVRPNDKTVKIKLSSHVGLLGTFEFPARTTIEELQFFAAEKLNCAAWDIRIIAKGRQPPTLTALSELGLTEEDNRVIALRRLRGGMMHASSARKDFEKLGEKPPQKVNITVPGVTDPVSVMIDPTDTGESVIGKVRNAIRASEEEPSTKKQRTM